MSVWILAALSGIVGQLCRLWTVKFVPVGANVWRDFFFFLNEQQGPYICYVCAKKKKNVLTFLDCFFAVIS